MDFVLVLLVSGLGMMAAFVAGIYHERANWNGLIARGKLPRPGQRWTEL